MVQLLHNYVLHSAKLPRISTVWHTYPAAVPCSLLAYTGPLSRRFLPGSVGPSSPPYLSQLQWKNGVLEPVATTWPTSYTCIFQMLSMSIGWLKGFARSICFYFASLSDIVMVIIELVNSICNGYHRVDCVIIMR